MDFPSFKDGVDCITDRYTSLSIKGGKREKD